MLLMLHKPRPTAAERAVAGLSRLAARLLAGVDALVMWPFRVAENRRVVETLAALSDHDLRDIGVSRHDLRDLAALPFHCDAGAFLSRRRAGRRFRR